MKLHRGFRASLVGDRVLRGGSTLFQDSISGALANEMLNRRNEGMGSDRSLPQPRTCSSSALSRSRQSRCEERGSILTVAEMQPAYPSRSASASTASLLGKTPKPAIWLAPAHRQDFRSCPSPQESALKKPAESCADKAGENRAAGQLREVIEVDRDRCLRRHPYELGKPGKQASLSTGFVIIGAARAPPQSQDRRLGASTQPSFPDPAFRS